MADSTDSTTETPADETPKGDAPAKDAATGDQLGEGGLKALQAERDARAAAEAKVKEYEAKATEAERAKLGETERLTLERDEHKTAAQAAQSKLDRLEVALEKGLSLAQAKRLVGKTRDELEKDADELLEMFGAKGKTPPAGGKPKEDLRGGGDPTDEPVETDPAKLAAKIPRD